MGMAILACQTLQGELQQAIKNTKVDYPVLYIESGLHNKPECLRQRIQQEIDRLDNVSVILLLFGYCGHGLSGIKSDKAKLVIPKVDDCIPLLLGSCDAKKRISQEVGTYFLTKGWLDGEKNLLNEFDYCVKRYGYSRALQIMKVMLNGYKRLMIIDTGVYPIDAITPKTECFARKLGLKHEVTDGSLRIITKLLQGQWDREFLVLEPGQAIILSAML
ncbi:hypothetical protein SPSIL_039980 [Sporomusa silvacetica DSM 10669]|uniref:DUF1638 domain-containing protein n=1 Tax=Sporomusa silvacetica DSM 10669 TaxID=1123289 RepID=A0ABZ3IPY8_9FIRM|nr:DUF1638 domain-containing protein [Sporomusa silvacetica]OZC16303.1 hypothetical protein SPSIL_38660 [Sporomusa silvacetica DSM 10669]